jgi:cysteinyl-tRNA synthetase
MKPKITNIFTKKKEVFEPVTKNKVLLYGCGITPYDYAHIGHGRSYVFIDLVVRFFKFLGYEIKYVRNVTDIDDKLLKKAKKLGDVMRYEAIANKFTELFQQEMGELNCLIPDAEPKVTENIECIIDFIKGLVEKEKAYVVDGDVYFDISTYKDYGQLSGKKLEDLVAGARVEVDKRKKSPADFALWKGNNKKEFWESPWGYGRPGWHIECSALAKKFLGETIDIHCGGMDLIFPHHENERAQSEALHGKIFAKYWMHNALLNIDEQKMSKSLGNILSLKEIFEKYDPIILRFYFLQHHYRTPIEFSFEMLDAAKVAYKKLVQIFADVEVGVGSLDFSNVKKGSPVYFMAAALADDFNSPKMLGILFENLQLIKSSEEFLVQSKQFLKQVCGLRFDLKEEEVEITPEIAELIEKREKARNEKRWDEADAIREKLREIGYEVHDK